MTLPSITVKGKHPYPPRITAFTQPFWDALRANRFITSTCNACGEKTFPPKITCPSCWSTDQGWTELDSRGTLYSWTRIHAAPATFQAQAPYAVGIVDLNCGIRLACSLVSDQEKWDCGTEVELVAINFDDAVHLAARPVVENSD